MIVAVTFRVVGWVEHVATVNAGKVLYPLPPAVRDTAVTTPEAIVAVPLAPEPPVPLKVKLCVPFVQPALPLLLSAPPVGLMVVLVELSLNTMLPPVTLVMVAVLPDEVAVALVLAAHAAPPHVPLMAFLKFVAFVLVVLEVVMQKAVDPQLDSYTYVMLPTVVVPPDRFCA